MYIIGKQYVVEHGVIEGHQDVGPPLKQYRNNISVCWENETVKEVEIFTCKMIKIKGTIC